MDIETTRRDGFALPAAIFALVIVGVLVTGGFFVARQESRIAVASQNATQAVYVAERGANQVMSEWDNSSFNSMATWSSQEFHGNTESGEWTVEVTRMSPTTYWVDSRGRITEGGNLAGAERNVGVTVRVIPADMEPPSALTTRGDVNMVGSSEVDGVDQDPGSWDGGQCTNNQQEDKPGILHDGSGTVSTSGGASYGGDPPSDVDSSIDNQTFTQFGDLTYQQLTAMADKQFSGGNINGTGPTFKNDGSCATQDQLNWGDPVNPNSECGNYFPMIHIAGDARIQSGGRGQGVMLVDGNLDLRGDFLFHGIIIVQGSFETQGSGNRIIGGVMASNATLDDQRLSGSSVVQQSTCATRRAITENDNLARPIALQNRSWVDLTSLSY